MLSPTGRYEVTFYEHEVFNTHWVQTPSIVDRQTGEILLTFQNTHWSLDERSWLGESQACFHVRKYPGNHQPGEIVVTLDCAARVATFADQRCAFAELEPRLDAALTWIYARPEEPPPTLLQRIQKFLRGG
jgi:hypothetical protein